MVITKSEEEKRKSIIDNLDKSMSVEAGAGAGKTTLVVARNIEQLKKGKLKAENLVDITFTNAAAQELRKRLLDKLHEEVNNEANTEAERDNLRQAIKDESLIQISTIHSFCKRLITEKSFAAKYPIDVVLLDDAQATKKKMDFFEKWYKKQDIKFLKYVNKEFTEGSAGVFIRDTFMDLCELPDDTEFIYEKDLAEPGACTNDVIYSEMTAQIDRLTQALVNCINIKYPNSLANFANIKDHDAGKKVASWLYKIYEEKNAPVFDSEAFITLYKKIWTKDGGFDLPLKKGNLKSQPLAGNIDSICEDFAAATRGETNLYNKMLAYQSALVVRLALEAREEYRDYCRLPENRHEITNDALLQEALNLIKNDEEARRHYQKQFACIYVDEFQDTDIVQRDLVELLCQDPDDPTVIRPGSLFFVGDPKQSIYSFRGADVDVYEQTRNKYKTPSDTATEVYKLDNNYRSEKPIISWVDKNFSTRFAPILSESYTNMVAPTDRTPGNSKVLKGVYTLNDPNHNSDKYSYDDRGKLKGNDANAVVAVVKHLKEDGFKIWKEDDTAESKYSEQPIDYKDFLILCSKKNDIAIYANKLKEAGIPVNLYGALDLKEDEIVLRLLQLYRGLAFSFDRKAKYSAKQVLMGSMINDDISKEAENKYDTLLATTKNMSGYQLLLYLVQHLEYLMEDKIAGEKMVRCQSRLEQLYEAIITNPLGNKKDIYEQISKYMESGVDKELSLEKDPDAVRFMNVHKAKGLEGKIVIVCARGDRKSFKGTYRYLKKYYPCAIKKDELNSKIVEGYLRITDNPRDPGTVKAIKELHDEMEFNERVRNDYVEATRAEEAIIFMDSLCSGSVYDDFDFSNTPDAPVTNLLTLSADLKADVEKAMSDETYGANLLVKPNRKKKKGTYDAAVFEKNCDDSQGGYTHLSITPSGMEVNDRDKWRPQKEVYRPSGNIFGKVMHRCFELLANDIFDEKDINTKKIINRSVMEFYDEIVNQFSDREEGLNEVKNYQTYLAGQTDKFMANTKLVDSIKNAKKIMTEISFAQYASYKELKDVNDKLKNRLDSITLENMDKNTCINDDEKYWINGQADLVIVDDKDIVTIIDYKSDQKGKYDLDALEEHLHRAYDNQQELYRYVLSKMLEVPMDNISYTYYHMYM